MIINLITFVYFVPIFGLSSGYLSESSVQLLRHDKTLAVLRKNVDDTIKFCSLYDLEKQVNAVEGAVYTYKKPVQPTSFEQMMKVIKKCQELSEMNVVHEPMSSNNINSTELQSFWTAIIPGTKWCGLGDKATGYHDLGAETMIDICCRTHDHCPIRLKAFRSDYGPINLSLYTKSHCRCDEDFYDCLKSLQSPLADVIGNFYFNILNIGCLEHRRTPKCIGHENEWPRLIKRQVQPVQFVSNRLLY